ncbi:MAG TPA: NAD-dependent malic enzyme, partial [Candidatus Binatia bacterium]
ARLLFAAGFPPANLLMVDSKGILHRGREDLKTGNNPYKWRICELTNQEQRSGGIDVALKHADVCIALAKSGPGVIRPEWISTMAKDAIVFACANPAPEIWPWEAQAAGARIAATGRSDFPNQVNNSLGFPGIFRGVLDVGASTISDEMCIAAAQELASCAALKGLADDHILPAMDEWEVVPRVAAAVGLKALEQGLARNPLSRAALIDNATKMVRQAQKQTRVLMQEGVIAPQA